MELGERTSYLKGLIDGLEINASTKEGKVILLMSEILREMAITIEDLQNQVDEIVDTVDVIDEDLGELENDFYEMDDECECGDAFDDYYEDDDDDDDDDDYEFLDDDDLYEVTCPTCGDSIYLNAKMLDEGSIDCPGCGELLEFDFSDIQEEEKEDKDKE